MAGDIGKSASSQSPLDVLIVGAGPTGLTLAAQLRAFGVTFRIIDRNEDRARESRALAVQARTVEIFDSLGIGEALVAKGNPSVQLAFHFEAGATAKVALAGFGATDTRFPFILFVSQAETEAILGQHLTGSGVGVERRVELVEAVAGPSGVSCRLRHEDGSEEDVSAQYVVGCDGAHSAIRKRAGIPFEGDAYLQDFMLGDVEADGLIEADTLHACAAAGSVAMFFPLRTPATWRVIAMGGGKNTGATASSEEEALAREALPLPELQAFVDRATAGAVRLRDPVWLTHFRLHHRQATTYRSGRMLLAGDAAHIHSPVGGQGMNTGIQDAWNLGWKLALVVKQRAVEELLDTYQAERWPVGRALLRYTDRIFSLFTRVMSGTRIAAWFRKTVVARVIPWVFRSPRLRRLAFKFVSELGISYRRSPAVAEGTPRLREGPRAGDRLPDAAVERNGRPSHLQRELAGPRFHLLLCGGIEGWDAKGSGSLRAAYAAVLNVEHLTAADVPNALRDTRGDALRRLGVRSPSDTAQYLVRPDGHVAARCAGRDLTFIAAYLRRWLR
jgi:2-polyprenyl-6-methoxyphenol hydroxylase-like FAD-dependent oxidoreductase